jgi:hypothetical protein
MRAVLELLTLTQKLPKVNRIAAGIADVMGNEISFETPAIPAQAGIQSVDGVFPVACGVDFHFRGNDCGWERSHLANDTSIAAGAAAWAGQQTDFIRHRIIDLHYLQRGFEKCL